MAGTYYLNFQLLSYDRVNSSATPRRHLLYLVPCPTILMRTAALLLLTSASIATAQSCLGRQVSWTLTGTLVYNECKSRTWLCNRGCPGQEFAGPFSNGRYDWYSTGCDCPVPDFCIEGSSTYPCTNMPPSAPSAPSAPPPEPWAPGTSEISSTISCSSGSWPSEVGWSLSCGGTVVRSGVPHITSTPVFVAPGVTCTLSMTDSWGDG